MAKNTNKPGFLSIDEMIKQAQAKSARKYAEQGDPGNYYDHSTPGLSLTGEDEIGTELSADSKDKTQDMNERAPGDTPDNASDNTNVGIAEQEESAGAGVPDLEPEPSATTGRTDPGNYESETDPELKVANFNEAYNSLVRVGLQLTEKLASFQKLAEDDDDDDDDDRDSAAHMAGEAAEGAVKEVCENAKEGSAQKQAAEEGYKIAEAFFSLENADVWGPAIQTELMKTAHYAERCGEVVADLLDFNKKAAEEALMEETGEEGDGSGSELMEEDVSDEIPTGDVGGEDALAAMGDPMGGEGGDLGGEGEIDPAVLEAIVQELIESGVIDEDGGDLVGGDDVYSAMDESGMSPEELAMINEKTGSVKNTAALFTKMASILSRKATESLVRRNQLITKLASQVSPKTQNVRKAAKQAMAETLKRGRRTR